MSSPYKPASGSPTRDRRSHHHHHHSRSRRSRPQDEEAGYSYQPQVPATPYSPTRKFQPESDAHSIPSPTRGSAERDSMMSEQRGSYDLGRKKSLIRPERTRIDRDHPNYHYRKHAQNMEVLPSTTGNDPILEDLGEAATNSSETSDQKSFNRGDQHGPGGMAYSDGTSPRKKKHHDATHTGKGSRKIHRKLTRKDAKVLEAEEKQRQKERENLRPPSFWNVYCAIVTFWCPNAVLKCFGKPAKAQQRAWREKMGLLSIILLICTFVGYLTFGFTATVCGTAGVRLKVNHVDGGYMIFHGYAYNLVSSSHPAADGIPSGSNVLYDLTHKYSGQDGSFLFQNVNGACKGLITKTNDSNIPSDSDGNLGWYFPCHAFNQDGSSTPNYTSPYYTGYACHTTKAARKAFYSLSNSGEVYFTWDDVKNSSRNLMVYSGSVLDLDLLKWFNTSDVSYPTEFDHIRKNSAVRGVDVTRAFQTAGDKKTAECLSQIIRVGSIDTETIGCIASKVVLYVSLVFILSIVLAKFFLALAFQWFLARRFAASTTSLGGPNDKKRQQEIEDWSDDIYRPPPKLGDARTGLSDKSSKRVSTLLPRTSRFTSPYAVDQGMSKRPPPTTMTSQNPISRLAAHNSIYKQGNGSQGTLPSYEPTTRMSMTAGGTFSGTGYSQDQSQSTTIDSEGPGSIGFIHENVVPQPPPEWQPFGYPLAHSICLVTAYSEGAEGIRTTLDSIATTDYPNSHKTILVICDGIIKGKGEDLSTPEIALSMMKEHAVLPDEVQAFSYVAVASGSKRHSMAKVYSGFYDYGTHSVIPRSKQQRVPMMVVVKCGTPDEAKKSKPGNRGKRDSQIILMSFLQKVMFDERMTELEFEMFNGLWKITGISPDFYETVLMVDADTKVFPDSLTHMISAMVKDPDIMGLCGETKIANKRTSWVTMIQVFEYFISHHQSKSFESVFGGVTCLPGCFCMYRIKAPKGGQNYWVPILANPDVVEHYSENVVDTLHRKNLLLLGEDRYLSTLMLKTFPKRKQVFVPQAVCKTTVPDKFSVLLSQRRRWINSTVHNLMELVLVRDLCGTFCFSMQFVVFIELVGTLVLPAAITFTFYVVIKSIIGPVQTIPIILLALILGLPAVLIVVTAKRWSYVVWMFIYLLSLPVWNFVLPSYAYWKFDDFSWGDTRKTAGEKTKKAGIEYEGEFDSTKITMKRWADFEKERRLRNPAFSQQSTSASGWTSQPQGSERYEY
ncbi:MAG: Chitin synthase, class 3 [Cirrosporium novae-zelandiae]|nr:MAG: Chitin synthase, class 3 [Cirrosporium novae-zelandiae]